MGTKGLCAASLGGGKRDRTADLLHAMQALSQLSYTPGTPKRARIIVMRPMLVKRTAEVLFLNCRDDSTIMPVPMNKHSDLHSGYAK